MKLHSINSYTKENMQNMKTYTDLLYIFVINQADHTSVTSTDTAVSTLTVAALSSSQESVNCMNSLTLKQLIAAISVN